MSHFYHMFQTHQSKRMKKIERWLWKLSQFSVVSFFVFFSSVKLAFAVEPVSPVAQPHIVVIANQVRGNECCSAGGMNELRQQLKSAEELKLPATFAIRYDALNSPEYVSLLKEFKQKLGPKLEIGAFLEITPSLATASKVPYTGNSENWYEAEHAFLVGYQPDDRNKLIDTYMAKFRAVFGEYPQSTNAWMIDAPSLKYLSEKYKVTSHELTREQWGTDSYTLYGGPAHYPYTPSQNWPLVPDSSSSLPIILRQTITDPVWNYGDPTSSFTSQPNDYRRRDRGFDYFQFLFTQAHQQKSEPYTFTLLGLENSMPGIDQDEFHKQLAFVQKTASQTDYQVLTASQFAEWFRLQSSISQPQVQSYSGSSEKDGASQAWTVSTDSYRVRVRRDHQDLCITDLRFYSPEFQDPYAQQAAQRHGHWIIPFLIDGSRFRQKATDGSILNSIPDNFSDRRNENGSVSCWPLSTENLTDQPLVLVRQDQTLQLKQEGTLIAEFDAGTFTLNRTPKKFVVPVELSSILQWSKTAISWQSRESQVLWQLQEQPSGNGLQVQPKVFESNLSQERQERYPFLFPELIARALDIKKTELYLNNQFALAGRNPVRVVFFPRDQYGYPVAVNTQPEVTSEPAVDDIQQESPHGSNGMIFIDFTHSKPGKLTVRVKSGDFVDQKVVFFAPNCITEKNYCLKHPVQAWWFIHNWVQDKMRSLKTQQEKEWLK